MEREVQPAKGAFQRVAVVDSDFPSSSEHVADDAWSLRFMNALRANQFIEFVGSLATFITIPEINKFTSDRPGDWR